MPVPLSPPPAERTRSCSSSSRSMLAAAGEATGSLAAAAEAMTVAMRNKAWKDFMVVEKRSSNRGDVDVMFIG